MRASRGGAVKAARAAQPVCGNEKGGTTVRYRLVPVDPQGRVYQLAALALARPTVLRAVATRLPGRRR